MAFLDVPSTTVSETLNLAELLVNCGASSSKEKLGNLLAIMQLWLMENL